jgi:hypothetical protein
VNAPNARDVDSTDDFDTEDEGIQNALNPFRFQFDRRVAAGQYCVPSAWNPGNKDDAEKGNAFRARSRLDLLPFFSFRSFHQQQDV